MQARRGSSCFSGEHQCPPCEAPAGRGNGGSWWHWGSLPLSLLTQGPWLTSLPSCFPPPRRPSPQDQLKQLQEILGSLSVQEEKTRASQRRLGQQLNSETQQSSSLVAQLRAMVAEREAKVRQLELEIGQLSTQVSRALARPSIQRHLSHSHLFPPAFIQGAPCPAWSHFGSLLLSGSPAHSAHTFPL